MEVTKASILQCLPVYQDRWQTVTETQDVDDIIRDIRHCHAEFRSYYDQFALKFYSPDIDQICDNLYEFCKKNIKYREEPERMQTTALPTGILTRGYGDCKHYASFIGGVLSAIGRLTGVPIDWHYCFASYKPDQPVPYHVFVVVDTDHGPVWIDPTPGATAHDPFWVVNERVDKKPKLRSRMGRALGRIGFVNSGVGCKTDPGCGCSTIGTISLPPANYINFSTQQTGKLLPSIPGYPKDLPQLQLTPGGQLQFYNWPTQLTPAGGWQDFAKVAADGSAPVISGPFPTSDWLGTWQRIGTKTPITAAQLASLEAAYKIGRQPDQNGDVFAGSWLLVPGAVPQVLGKYFQYDHGQWWQSMRPMDWIKENIAYYLRYYLKTPYNLDALISFGTGWPEQLQNAIQNGKMQQLLPNINFLAQPTGKKTFWDSFYSIVPLIILGAESIITLGAATPALVAAMAAAKLLLGAASNAQAAQANNALNQQVLTDVPTNFKPGTDLNPEQPGGAGAGTGPGVLGNNTNLILMIAGAGLIAYYFMEN